MGILDFFKKKVKGGDSCDQSFNFEKMYRKTFYRYEATYRHQFFVLPRFKAENGISLGKVLLEIMPDDFEKHIVNVSVLKTVQFNEVETNFSYFINIQEALQYDLFWNFNYKNDEGEIYPISDTNITIVVKTDEKEVSPYVILFVRGTAIGFEDVYTRITMMVPHVKKEDELRSFQSSDAPSTFSFLISCSKTDNSKYLAEYEEAEKRVLKCINKNKPLKDDVDAELFRGLREMSTSDWYLGYGTHLIEQERYKDASSVLLRAINRYKAYPSDESRGGLQLAWKAMAKCMTKINKTELAAYYYVMNLYEGKADRGECADFFVKTADPRAPECIYRYLIEKYGEDEKSWQEEAHAKRDELFNAYNDACNKWIDIIGEKVSFYSDNSIGFILNRLLQVDREEISGMSIISKKGEVVTMTSQEEVWSESIYKYLDPGTTLVLPFSKAYYVTGNKVDKSILCTATSIIIYVEDADINKHLVRVNIMVPNFNNDDDKHDVTSNNIPINNSFIISSIEEPKLIGTDSVDDIYEYALSCKREKRFFEAQAAFLYLYKYVSVRYMRLNETDTNFLFEVAYQLNYCYQELNLYGLALFYIDLAIKEVKSLRNRIEFVNVLVNNKEPVALDFIKAFINEKYDDEESDDLKLFIAFLKRREIHVLVDKKEYDEAEVLLEKIKDDPLCKDFVLKEQEYINGMRNQ